MNHRLKVELSLIGVLSITAIAAAALTLSQAGREFLDNNGTLWHSYFWTTTIFVFWIFQKYPGQKKNLIGDVMAAFLLGWMWWPFAIWYAVRVHRRNTNKQ